MNKFRAKVCNTGVTLLKLFQVFTDAKIISDHHEVEIQLQHEPEIGLETAKLYLLRPNGCLEEMLTSFTYETCTCVSLYPKPYSIVCIYVGLHLVTLYLQHMYLTLAGMNVIVHVFVILVY